MDASTIRRLGRFPHRKRIPPPGRQAQSPCICHIAAWPELELSLVAASQALLAPALNSSGGIATRKGRGRPQLGHLGLEAVAAPPDWALADWDRTQTHLPSRFAKTSIQMISTLVCLPFVVPISMSLP